VRTPNGRRVTPEAVQVAIGLVSERIDEIPKDRTVLCICRVARRSGTVATTLAGAGYDAINIAGECWPGEQAGLSVVTTTETPSHSLTGAAPPHDGDGLPGRLRQPARLGVWSTDGRTWCRQR